MATLDTKVAWPSSHHFCCKLALHDTNIVKIPQLWNAISLSPIVTFHFQDLSNVAALPISIYFLTSSVSGFSLQVTQAHQFHNMSK